MIGGRGRLWLGLGLSLYPITMFSFKNLYNELPKVNIEEENHQVSIIQDQL